MTRNVWLRCAALAAAVLAVALVVGVSVVGATRDGVARLLCKQQTVAGVIHFCGPATAKLSVFSGVTFRNGKCVRQTVGGAPLLSVGIGILSRNRVTNKGLGYFGLTISGPLSKPTGGGVIAYYRSKRWGGRGVSFKAAGNGGTFVVKGIRGSSGTASGSFHC